MAEFAEVDSTGHLITICVIHMIVLFIPTPCKLKTPVMFSKKERGA